MDVYIGFGLLTAGIVIVAFIVFDGWFKKRKFEMSGLSELQEIPIDEPEYTVRVRSLEEASPDFTGEAVSVLPRKAEPVSEEKKPARSPEKNPLPPGNLLILSVMAKKESRFESYDLLQAISAAGMQFGEMNIFHYYHTTPVGRVALFSMASANKPGDFDLNHFAEFSCSGLMLFMDIAKAPDPQSAFKLMLDTAERLAEDLDATLCADPATPWNEKLAWQYHQKIMQYKTAARHENKSFA